MHLKREQFLIFIDLICEEILKYLLTCLRKEWKYYLSSVWSIVKLKGEVYLLVWNQLLLHRASIFIRLKVICETRICCAKNKLRESFWNPLQLRLSYQ